MPWLGISRMYWWQTCLIYLYTVAINLEYLEHSGISLNVEHQGIIKEFYAASGKIVTKYFSFCRSNICVNYYFGLTNEQCCALLT